MRKMTVLATMMALMALMMAVSPAMARDGSVSQSFEQETESGDVDQSFEISGGGDNGSSCVNAQGDSNTGNLQDVSGFVSFDSDIDDFEQDDIGSDLTVDGSSDVSCDQQVNQAAAAG